MELKDIKKIVFSIVSEITDISALCETTPLVEVGVNSIQIIELVLKLENEFCFEFETENLSYKTLRTVSSISEYIYKKLRK